MAHCGLRVRLKPCQSWKTVARLAPHHPLGPHSSACVVMCCNQPACLPGCPLVHPAYLPALLQVAAAGRHDGSAGDDCAVDPPGQAGALICVHDSRCCTPQQAVCRLTKGQLDVTVQWTPLDRLGRRVFPAEQGGHVESCTWQQAALGWHSQVK